MKTVQTATFVASAALAIASSSAFSATAQSLDAPELLVAWQNAAGRSAPAYAYQDLGAVQAVTPDLEFATQSLSTNSFSDVNPLSYRYPLTERTTLGFGLGATGDYAGSRNFALDPSLAYSLNSNLAVSVGLNTAYFEPARLNGFGSTAECVALEANGALPLYTCSNAISYMPANLAGSRAGFIEADGWGYGYNLGATLTLGESTRLGVRYRSGMQSDVEDESVFYTAGPLLSTDLGRLTDQAVIAGLGLPESFAVGASHQLSDSVSLAGDVTWVNWSQFDEARIAPRDSSGAASTQYWENTYRYTLGVNYQHNDRWKYRVGAAYDQSPVPSNQVNAVQPLVNDDLVWVAFGVGYSPTPRLSLDVGYAYPVFTDPRLSDGLQHNLAGQFEGESDILSAQFKWRFE